MHLFKKLEQRIEVWFLLGISLLFFLLRFPSLFEPYWYGDEGIYEVIGHALRQGRFLYTDIWDNKPPFLYLVYALFDGNQFWVRLASLVVGLLSVIIFFFFAKKLFQSDKISMFTTILYAVLFGLPLLEGNIANAENFMLLPIISACFLVFTLEDTHLPRHIPKQKAFFLAGFLLGCAFLFKIVAIFDMAACFTFMFFLHVPEKFTLRLDSLKKVLQQARGELRPFILGILTLPVITLVYFTLHGALIPLLKATFLGNIGYVGYGNQFLFPQGLLVIKLILLAAFLFFLFLKRSVFSHTSLFLLLWLAFSFFNLFFSQRPYTHYVLVLLPSLCLALGYVFLSEKVRKLVLLLVIIVIGVLALNFKIFNLQKQLHYYSAFIAYASGQKSERDYQNFFDHNTPRDYDVALYIKTHTHPQDQIFIWGNSAQIYALSHKLPLGKYTVAYHISTKEAVDETQKQINEKQPKYVIILNNAGDMPLLLSQYAYVFSIADAHIYERILK